MLVHKVDAGHSLNKVLESIALIHTFRLLDDVVEVLLGHILHHDVVIL